MNPRPSHYESSLEAIVTQMNYSKRKVNRVLTGSALCCWLWERDVLRTVVHEIRTKSWGVITAYIISMVSVIPAMQHIPALHQDM